METFVRIVEKGSLTAAANALDTSLPTVVRTLASLERHLGVMLLHRTTRRIRLTEEGALYLERCRVILSATHEAEETLISREAELRGNLTVGASVLFGRRYVAPVVNDFLRRHPKVTIDLRFGDRVLNLSEEHVDVAVRIAHLKDSSLVAIPVGHVRRVVCATGQYLRSVASRRCRMISGNTVALDIRVWHREANGISRSGGGMYRFRSSAGSRATRSTAR